MISVCFNQKMLMLDQSCSLKELLEKQGYLSDAYALVVNQTFVASSQHAIVLVQDQDVIETIVPMQGG